MKAPVSLLLLAALTCIAAPGLAAEGQYGPHAPGEKDKEILDVVNQIDGLYERRGYLYTYPESVALVERVGASVVPDGPVDPYMQFKFRILRDPSPNAFALPNGSIYVTTGLLVRLKDEAQLAAILAHEANHVLGHHTFISQDSYRKKSAGVIAGSMILSVATASLGGIGGELVRQASQVGLQVLYVASVLGYSRDLEEEADRRAVDRMMEAGYDPRAMVDVFAILDTDYEGLDIETSGFWMDHPKLQTRAAYTKDIIAHLDPPLEERTGLVRNAPPYLAMKADAIRREIPSQAEAGNTRTAVALARLLLEEHGESAENWTCTGDAWRALGPRPVEPPPEQTTRKAKKKEIRREREQTDEELESARFATPQGKTAWETNRTEAEEAYRKALALDPGYAEARRGLGYLYEKDDRPALAVPEFRAYLDARPEARDRAVIERHLARTERAAALAPPPPAPMEPAQTAPKAAPGPAPPKPPPHAPEEIPVEAPQSAPATPASPSS